MHSLILFNNVLIPISFIEDFDKYSFGSLDEQCHLNVLCAYRTKVCLLKNPLKGKDSMLSMPKFLAGI